MVVTVLPSTSAPSWPSSFFMVMTSPRPGTLRKVEHPLAKSDAARIGSAAFLAPETWTSPFRRRPPLTSIVSNEEAPHPRSPNVGQAGRGKDRLRGSGSGSGGRGGLALLVLVATTREGG